MRREMGPEHMAAFDQAVEDATAAVAYAAPSEETPSGPKPPSWWHGDEEASDLAMGWTAAKTVEGVVT